MSYEKCNGMSFSPSKRTVSLSLASSNVVPTEYQRVVMEADTDEDFILNILSVFRSLMGGGIQFSTATRSQVQEAYFWALKYIKDQGYDGTSYTWVVGEYDKLLKKSVENIVFAKFLSEAFRKTRREKYGVLYSRTGPYYWDPVDKIPYPDYSLITKFGRKNQYGGSGTIQGAPGFTYSLHRFKNNEYFLEDFGSSAFRSNSVNVFDLKKHNTCDRILNISESDLTYLMLEVYPRLRPIGEHEEEFKAYNEIHKIVQVPDENV